ncbi:branched-chain amino acid transaminase [Parvularcula sp. LCG005]|uniref:branched-chain amino acid transaminase n=1 Tax=Parvularcula sp. LCG005 TaxID=3078805 RepID=UPI0029425E9D|nr:branched-chain amino acid transaminase [Parvularcula sp. LCG005]WOI52134.1 branched-chain amino acid transaminase [Parvularcula sp. LCG005]
MPIKESKYIWRSGEMVPWAEATTHVMTHALLYGTCAFEGSRAYKTPTGTYIFRNDAHIDRLFYSARIYGIGIHFTADELMEATRRTVRENGLESAYIRTNAYLGYGEMSPSATGAPNELDIIAFEFGRYLGADAVEKGIDVGVSSWRRAAPGTQPAGVKMAGNYLSSRLITMEAKKQGLAEGIGLTHDGTVSEGGGENIFMVKDGRVVTPPLANSLLGGITRNSVITILKDKGVELVEQSMSRESMYGADELFFTGTAAEVTPIRSVDGLIVGKEGDNPITKMVQDTFFGLFDGTTEDRWGWLDKV